MLPLSEKTIIITRPREQAAQLKSELERLGAKIVLFPTIEIVPPDSYEDLDLAILNLSDYDWLIFTSANAAEHFLRRLKVNSVETSELDYLRICAIGEATFERFRQDQVHVDVLPNESSAESVFTSLNEYLGGEKEFKNLRFLLPRSSIGREFLPQRLREAEASVADVTAYQTILPAKSETGKIKALLQGGAIDCITFTSPSTFKNFVKLFGESDLSDLLNDVAIACLGETTAQTVRENNLTPYIVAAHADTHHFAAAIAGGVGKIV